MKDDNTPYVSTIDPSIDEFSIFYDAMKRLPDPAFTAWLCGIYGMWCCQMDQEDLDEMVRTLREIEQEVTAGEWVKH